MTALLLFGTTSVHASTIFVPTDIEAATGDTNFIEFPWEEYNLGLNGELAMFDDTAVMSSANALSINTGVFQGNRVVFSESTGGDWLASMPGSAASIVLTNSFSFKLGATFDGGLSWVEDIAVTDLGGFQYNVKFFNEGSEMTVGLHAIDLTEASIPSVPVPASVWLFGSGLIGLVGVARRKV